MWTCSSAVLAIHFQSLVSACAETTPQDQQQLCQTGVQWEQLHCCWCLTDTALSRPLYTDSCPVWTVPLLLVSVWRIALSNSLYGIVHVLWCSSSVFTINFISALTSKRRTAVYLLSCTHVYGPPAHYSACLRAKTCPFWSGRSTPLLYRVNFTGYLLERTNTWTPGVAT